MADLECTCFVCVFLNAYRISDEDGSHWFICLLLNSCSSSFPNLDRWNIFLIPCIVIRNVPCKFIALLSACCFWSEAVLWTGSSVWITVIICWEELFKFSHLCYFSPQICVVLCLLASNTINVTNCTNKAMGFFSPQTVSWQIVIRFKSELCCFSWMLMTFCFLAFQAEIKYNA